MIKRQGYTLIELVITIGIVGLVIGVTGGVLVSVVKANHRASLLSEINRSSDTIFGKIEEDIRKASNIKCKVDTGDTPPTTCSTIEYTVQDNTQAFANNHVEIGFIPGTENTNHCDNGEPNGYVYYRDYVAGSNTVPTSAERINSTDPESGLNIKDLLFTIRDDGKNTTVVVNMTVSQSVCNKIVEHEQTFNDFMISRVD